MFLLTAATNPQPETGVIRELMQPITTAALWSTTSAWDKFGTWLADSYTNAPALMLVIMAVILLPPLAIGGLVLRRQRRSPDATIIVSRPSRRGDGTPRAVTERTKLSTWPTQAWLENGDKRHIIGRVMVRIGREDDNDICLPQQTVHRYHVAVRRTADGSVLITDLSGKDGNGVFVNGARVSEARLKPGDEIAVGEVKLKFAADPA